MTPDHLLFGDPRVNRQAFSQPFAPQPKQLELARSKAPNRLAVGGIRSGKTTSALAYGIFNYVLPYAMCDILVLRRTFRQLETGAITDLKTFFTDRRGNYAFDWNDTKHIATFANRSRVIFGSCTHNKDSDIEQYLGQGYPFILLDECSQFSPDAYILLQSRNTVGPGTTLLNRDPNFAYEEMPSPVIWGCTNPIGPFWMFYKSIFVDRKPVGTEGAQRDLDGRWYVHEAGERRCVYNPADYAIVHSTVLDNPAIQKRDPRIIARLNAMPTAQRDKMLFGLLDRVEGQYYDHFSPEHVINLRDDPGAVVWQPHQPIWAGWDWGMAHHNTVYMFTKALVRRPGGDHKLKTVCFSETVTSSKDQREIIAMLVPKLKLPNGEPFRLSAIYFSHEKFARSMEKHSAADVISDLLRAVGQPHVTPATRDRVGRASFLYNMLQTGELVILDTCPEIINALPTLQRNPDKLDDVLKVDNKADDCYDGFSYGLFGQLAPRGKSREVIAQERVAEIADPLARHFVQFKLTMDRQAKRKPYRFPWEAKIRTPDGSPLRR